MKSQWESMRFIASLTPSITSAAAWRLASPANATVSPEGWWSVAQIEYYSELGCPAASKVDTSTSAGTAFGSTDANNLPPSNAFDGNVATYWSGTNGANENWVGMEFMNDVTVRCIKLNQPPTQFGPEFVTELTVEVRLVGDVFWTPVFEVKNLVDGENTFENDYVPTPSPTTPVGPTKSPITTKAPTLSEPPVVVPTKMPVAKKAKKSKGPKAAKGSKSKISRGPTVSKGTKEPKGKGKGSKTSRSPSVSKGTKEPKGKGKGSKTSKSPSASKGPKGLRSESPTSYYDGKGGML
jgi:hypothetical protein